MPKHLTCRISDDLDAQIDDLADRLNLPRAEVIRNALTSGLAEGKLVAGLISSPLVKALVRALLAIDGDEEQLRLFERMMRDEAVSEHPFK